MNTRTPTMLPQNAPSFLKPLLQAFALIAFASLLFGALWARASDLDAPPAAHVSAQ